MSKKKSRTGRSAGAQRAAERAAVIRAEQERKERRRRTAVVTATVLVVLAAVAGIAFAVQSSRDTTGRQAAVPSGALDTYALPMGNVEAPVKVTVYEDFLCPFCAQFEAESRGLLKAYAAAGDVSVRYHVVSFLDDASDDEYSTRAANALGVVLDSAGPEVAVVFHDLLYENQPPEGGPGLSDEKLVDLAVEAGADPKEVTGPIESRRFEQWVVNSTNAWSKAGFNGTPTVTVNGERVAYETVPELVQKTRAAVEAARAE